MDAFLNSFALFGMGLLGLIILLSQGIKSGYAQATGIVPTGVAMVAIVVAVSEVLLGMVALLQFAPASEPYVRLALAAIALPVSALGGFDMAKGAVVAIANGLSNRAQ